VYTRMVRDPAWGLKVTGKEGPNTVGAYVVEDEITNLIFPGAETSSATTLKLESTATVARYKRDFGNRFTLGLLATDRQGDEYHNRVVGADLDMRLNDQDRVQVELLGSATRYPDRVAADFDQPTGEFDDIAAYLYYTHTARTLSVWVEGKYLGDGFRADLGFLPRVDTRGGQVGISYDWIGTDETWYSLINLKAAIQRLDDQAGNLLFEEEAVQLTANGPMQSQMIVRAAGGREGYAGQVFGANTLVLKGVIQPNGHSEVTCILRTGDRVDYANARQGRRLQLNPTARYDLGRHLRMDGAFLWERMKVDEGRLYTASVSDLTAAWYFSSRSFVRAVLQYVDYRYDTNLYADGRAPRFRQLFSQFLYSYKLNPRTVLFLGYSDNSFDQPGVGLTRADRTVFAKVGYAWLL